MHSFNLQTATQARHCAQQWPILRFHCCTLCCFCPQAAHTELQDLHSQLQERAEALQGEVTELQMGHGSYGAQVSLGSEAVLLIGI
jgi:hypothetical protein